MATNRRFKLIGQGLQDVASPLAPVSGDLLQFDGNEWVSTQALTGAYVFSGSTIDFVGMTVDIQDATGVDQGGFFHDGVDFNTRFTGTTDWNIRDGVILKVFDATDTNFVNLSHNGTNGVLGLNVGDFIITPPDGNSILINGALELRSLDDTITASQNNYSPTGMTNASVIHVSSDGSYNITGIATGREDRILIIRNQSSVNTLTLVHASGSSSASNQLVLPGNANVALTPNSGAILIYDAARWRMVSQ